MSIDALRPNAGPKSGGGGGDVGTHGTFNRRLDVIFSFGLSIFTAKILLRRVLSDTLFDGEPVGLPLTQLSSRETEPTLND